jgi:hypothetical protein
MPSREREPSPLEFGGQTALRETICASLANGLCTFLNAARRIPGLDASGSHFSRFKAFWFDALPGTHESILAVEHFPGAGALPFYRMSKSPGGEEASAGC